MTRDLQKPALPAPATDPWARLRDLTPARIGIGRAGTSLPTREVLAFAASHAMARDAVHIPLDVLALQTQLKAQGWSTLAVTSRASSRDAYLRRPDWGRRLSPSDALRLADGRGDSVTGAPTSDPVKAATPTEPRGPSLAAPDLAPDLAVVVADGLSSVAAQRHAANLLSALRRQLGHRLSISPVVIATQARVALADEIGELLGASIVLILIGERPGLSSPDSLGAYLTVQPKVGRSDAERNCVSNIRPEGLPLADAAQRIAWLLLEGLRRGVTGVALKDDSDKPLLGAANSVPRLG